MWTRRRPPPACRRWTAPTTNRSSPPAPRVLDVLPEDHPYYAHWAQTVNYAYSLQCQPAFEAQQWDSVIAYCQMAVEANPGAFIMNYFLGVAHQTKQDWANTAVNFAAFLDGVRGNSEAASQLGDQVATAQRSGGIAYARAGAMQDAIPLLQAAARASGTDVEVHYRLAVALLSTGDSAGAERAFSVVIDNAPNPIASVLFLAGQLNYNAGDYAKADTRLTAYLANAGGDRGVPDAHFMLAQALQGSDEDRAVTHYQGFLSGSAAGDARGSWTPTSPSAPSSITATTAETPRRTTRRSWSWPPIMRTPPR